MLKQYLLLVIGFLFFVACADRVKNNSKNRVTDTTHSDDNKNGVDDSDTSTTSSDSDANTDVPNNDIDIISADDSEDDQSVVDDSDFKDDSLPSCVETVSIKDIQNLSATKHPESGCQVTISSASVISESFVVSVKSHLKGFFVADTQGGAYSGILVVYDDTLHEVDVSIGSTVSLTGIYEEFDPCIIQSDPTSCTWPTGSQIRYLSHTDLSQSSSVPAKDVQVDELDPLSVQVAQYESVLVKISNTVVTQATNSYGEFIIGGKVTVDDAFFSCPVKADEIITSVVGVYYYSFGKWKLLPRSLEDIDSAGKCEGGNNNQNTGSPDPYPNNPADHLLISEIRVTPTTGEFIEIYNPTSNTIPLTNYYIANFNFKGNTASDAKWYYEITTKNLTANDTDFIITFPIGSSIGPKEFLTIATHGAADYKTTYQIDADYVIPASTADLTLANTRAMEVLDIYSSTATTAVGGKVTLSNDGEDMILFHWDGISSLVSDVDYIIWGDKDEASDKSGITVNGSTYKNDTPIANQEVVHTAAHGLNESFQRIWFSEGDEVHTGGNGKTGHNETSEPLSKSWIYFGSAPTPGAEPAVTP